MMFFFFISAVVEFNVGLYTWYMSFRHYHELRKDGHTELVVPLLDHHYELPIDIIALHYHPVADLECRFKEAHSLDYEILRPSGASYYYTYTRQRVLHTQYTVYLSASAEKSGTYSLRCSGASYYRPEKEWVPATITKELTLRFEKSTILDTHDYYLTQL